MHKLGNGSLTANDKRNEIKAILTARRNLYNAGVALLECDNVYASNIKFALERLTFSRHTVPFVGAGAVKKQIDETDIMLYLETFMRIYVKPESIVIDRQNGICKIRLNGKTTANIRIKNGTSVKSILFQSE